MEQPFKLEGQMTFSYTATDTQTFTITHARHIASKVATDLKRMQRLYGQPSDSAISDYEKEIIELLKAGCLDTVDFGYRRNSQWIEPTLRYKAMDFANIYMTDDDPGRIRPGADIQNASFYSFLTYNSKWDRLTSYEKDAIESCIPIKRTTADAPGINGYLSQDKLYSSGGRALQRETVRSY